MQTRSRKHWMKPFFYGVTVSVVCLAAAASLFFEHFRELAARERIPAEELPEGETYIGPWGTLTAVRLSLVNPDGGMTDRAERLQPPVWFFEGYTERQLMAFIDSCNLIPPERKALLDRSNWTLSPAGCAIVPPSAALWFLGSDARTRIYDELSKSSKNYAQQHPFRFPYNGFENALKTAGLRTNAINLLKRLSYREGGYTCFTDLVTAQEVMNGAEFTNLVEALYQLPTYQLKLRLTADANFDALMSYWGRGGRSNLIRPLLKSTARLEAGQQLNVSYLLPSFPRLRLYTYPDAWNDATAAQQDCFFTAANFFNDAADTNLLDRAALDHKFEAEYAHVSGSPTYGDVVMLLDDAGKPIHAAVYIAGDFVFTKNGVNSAQPWVLMKLGDMLNAYFPAKRNANITVLRHRDRAGSADAFDTFAAHR